MYNLFYYVFIYFIIYLFILLFVYLFFGGGVHYRSYRFIAVGSIMYTK